jgi:MoaA/NifB/PqqE/SkfB family radical SAM enzyme
MLEREMTTSVALNAMTTLAHMGVDYLYVTGGEPFCRTDLAILLRKAAELFASVSIASNGLLIEREHIDVLKHVAIEYVAISFDNIYTELLWTSDDRRKLCTIEALAQSGIACRIGVPIRSESIDMPKLEALGSLASSVSIPLYFRFLEYVPGIGSDVSLLTETNRQHISARLEKWAAATGVEIHIVSEGGIESENDICPAGEHVVFLDNQGCVWPCSWLAKSGQLRAWGKAFGSGAKHSLSAAVQEFRSSLSRQLTDDRTAIANPYCPALAIMHSLQNLDKNGDALSVV